MIYLLEFHGDRPAANASSLEQFTTEDISLGEARIQATSILRHVKFVGGVATFCIIKSERGAVLGEVRANVALP